MDKVKRLKSLRAQDGVLFCSKLAMQVARGIAVINARTETETQKPIGVSKVSLVQSDRKLCVSDGRRAASGGDPSARDGAERIASLRP